MENDGKVVENWSLKKIKLKIQTNEAKLSSDKKYEKKDTKRISKIFFLHAWNLITGKIYRSKFSIAAAWITP